MNTSAALPMEKPDLAGTRQSRLLHGVLAGAFVALLVATPLLPSDTISLARDGRIAAPAMLWLVLATCATFFALTRPTVEVGRRATLTWPDLFVGIFIVWVVIAAIIASTTANRRAGWNMAATWATLGITYYLARLLLNSPLQIRAIFAGIAALGLMFAIAGWYERLVTIPENQRKFAQNPQAVLTDAGIDSKPGSAEYDQFRSRLETQGPAATFTLENSFAGFLAPCLVIGLLLWFLAGASSGAANQKGMLGSAMIIATVGIVAGTIFYTRSNAAMAATAIAIAVGGVGVFTTSASFPGRTLRLSALVFLVIILLWPLSVAFINLPLRERLPLTLQYRIEYWQSCAEMVRELPLLGCGPGNFQDIYSQYKLPQASETIADPHNFVWDILCNSGLIAFGFAACAFFGWLRRPVFEFLGAKNPNEETPNEQMIEQSVTKSLPLLWGAIAGVPLAVLLSLSSGSSFLFFYIGMFLLLGVVPAAALLWGVRRWILHGELPAVAIWLAWLPLAIHLTVSGGISNPGTGTLFVLLAALAVSALRNSNRLPILRTPILAVGLTLMAIATLAHYQWGYLPVLASEAAMGRAEAAAASDQPTAAKAAMKEAASADPWAASALQKLAFLQLQSYLVDVEAGEQEPEPLIKAASEAIERSPKSHSLRFEMAMVLMRAHAAAPAPQLLENAREQLLAAAKLAPTRAVVFAYLTYVEYRLGDRAAAKRAAAEALRLDSLNPHEQYDLSREPSPISGRTFPGWLQEMAATRL